MRASEQMLLDAAPASTRPTVGSRSPHQANFRIGNFFVEVNACRDADVTLVPPLALFRSESGAADIKIQIEWVNRLSPIGRQVFDSGATWRLCERDGVFQFDFSAPFFGEEPYKRLLVDHRFRRATLQMNESCAVRSSFPGAALSYPLDELLIMHRLTQEKAIELHCCGIVRPDGTGNLFVGHSGAGKSTTTRLWLAREDVQILSDDRIIVRRNTPEDRSTMRMYGTPWHGEAMFASPGSALLKRIFILQHGHGNVLTRLSPSQAVAELFARSFVPFHRHEYVDSALEFLQELVAAVPCYRYDFEPNEAAVERILEFRD